MKHIFLLSCLFCLFSLNTFSVEGGCGVSCENGSCSTEATNATCKCTNDGDPSCSGHDEGIENKHEEGDETGDLPYYNKLKTLRR